jgi:hypothetical protein
MAITTLTVTQIETAAQTAMQAAESYTDSTAQSATVIWTTEGGRCGIRVDTEDGGQAMAEVWVTSDAEPIAWVAGWEQYIFPAGPRPYWYGKR